MKYLLTKKSQYYFKIFKAEFRFYWTDIKLNDFTSLKKTSQINPYTFINVTRIGNLTDVQIQESIVQPFEFEVIIKFFVDKLI